ncbi:MAG: tRNA (adenosine(37)-N6)-threonylcarbamoyltransferase complex dimerization subunit type 1 TsaB [Chloroflexota bacterium]
MAPEQEQHGWLLALDTSATVASIALAPVQGGPAEVAGEITWEAGRNQTVTLLGQVDGLFRLCGIEADQLAGVIVATGPGSFNALRVGMSVAKTFCFAHDLPIFGIGTLEAAAHAFADRQMPVRAFVDAGRKRVVVGDFRPAGGGLVQRGELEHRTRDELADGLIEPTVLAGDLSEEMAFELGGDERVVIPPPAVRRRRASLFLDLGYQRWLTRDADDLIGLEPVYIHSRPRRTMSGERST